MKSSPTEHLYELKDSARFGYVADEYKDTFVVIEGKLASHGYAIPKDKVEGYDGRELSLKMRHDEISIDLRTVESLSGYSRTSISD